MTSTPLHQPRRHGTLPGFGHLFRYAKAQRTRTYGLKALDGHRSELWVVSTERGRAERSRRLVMFDDDADVEPFVRDVEQQLRRGGWSSV